MIRRAREGDIDAILSLLVQVDMVHHRGRPDLFKGPATKYTREELTELIRDDENPVFVFEDGDGRVLAHAFCNIITQPANRVLTGIKTLYIDDICVDESARGRHIGTALYEHVTSFARETGCYNVTLSVWECNPAAKSFYEKLGMNTQKTVMEKIL